MNIVEYAYFGYIKGHSICNLMFKKHEIKFSRAKSHILDILSKDITNRVWKV